MYLGWLSWPCSQAVKGGVLLGRRVNEQQEPPNHVPFMLSISSHLAERQSWKRRDDVWTMGIQTPKVVNHRKEGTVWASSFVINSVLGNNCRKFYIMMMVRIYRHYRREDSEGRILAIVKVDTCCSNFCWWSLMVEIEVSFSFEYSKARYVHHEIII
jgi:hypothetical protein